MQEMTAEQKKFYQMTEAPVAGVISRLAVPTIISMLVTSVYNMADTYFVSQLGTSASGAVGVILPLMALIQAIGFTLGVGSGSMISRVLGAKDHEKAEVYAAVGFFTAFGCGILLTAAAFLMGDRLALLLGSTETILPYARDYMDIIMIGAPFMAASFTLNGQLRFSGNSFLSMLGIGFGGVLNMFLDPLFIFTFEMGIAGAALATIISQIVSFVILFCFCVRKNAAVRLRISAMRPDGEIYSSIMRMGMPSLFRQGIGSVATIELNHFASAFGDPAIAAMGIVNRVLMFLSSALIGFGQGFQPVCGYSYGAKKYDRIREAYWFCLKVATVFLLVVSVAVFFNAPEIITVFRRGDPEVIAIGARALRFECIALPFFGIYIVNSMLTQTLGRSMRATLLACARQGIFFLPAIPLLTMNFGLTGIQAAQPAAEFCSFLLSVWYGFITLRELGEEAEQALDE